MKLTAIIVDDERLARLELRSLLSEFDEVFIIGEAENLTEAVKLIQTDKPDVIFLDIQLHSENGFDLLEKVEKNFKLIFVTAFDAFAIRAFETNALDYLLKPVNPERLAKTIERLLENDEKQEINLRKLEYEDRLFIEIGERSKFLKISSIKCICADGDYTQVFTDDGKKHLITKPLKEWEERLPEKYFVRIHRSTIVNLEFIEKVEGWFSRSYQVFIKDIKQPLTISRRYSAIIKEKFN
ncbi:MAG: LytTR family DNA-binding domain-containing protein [Pyrinomonadaceae bacterium]|jgi:two-component system LytT family response regulator|nr:LytTR family DNA-binding domain-containing protein [Pyrinomonadaceae bacterium]